MNNLLKCTIQNYIKKQYACISNITDNKIICPFCNKQYINKNAFNKNAFNNEEPIKNKIERDTVLYPDLKGHVDRY